MALFFDLSLCRTKYRTMQRKWAEKRTHIDIFKLNDCFKLLVFFCSRSNNKNGVLFRINVSVIAEAAAAANGSEICEQHSECIAFDGADDQWNNRTRVRF